MFDKALGIAVWKLGTAYLRRRYARYAKAGVAVAAVSILAAAYLAARSREGA